MEFVDVKMRTAAFIWAFTLFPAVLCCDRCIHKSKVTYNSGSGAINTGACGYESYAARLNGGVVSTAGAKIYREGVGCGACYEIRCTDPNICTKIGVKVVVTDFTPNNQSDFVLPSKTFASLAQRSKSAQLVKMGLVDVEYKRIPCDYPGQNLTVKIDKSSSYPNYLAVQFLFQGGQTDITGVEVAQLGSSNWNFMTRDYGAIWSTKQPPMGPLSLRLLVTSGYDGFWVWPKRNLLPANWKPGLIYDSGIQIKEIAQEGCSTCATAAWEDDIL